MEVPDGTQEEPGNTSPKLMEEEFISLLGHDLRNPISSLMMAAELLSTADLDEDLLEVSNTIKRTSHRMAGLVDNILEFARCNFGEGILLRRYKTDALEKNIQQVIKVVRIIFNEKKLDTNFDLKHSVDCDVLRIAQMVLNMVCYSMQHTNIEDPVFLQVNCDEKRLLIDVTHKTGAQSHGDLEDLFDPFVKASGISTKKSLGLGMYVAREIAVAHGGTLEASVEQHLFKLTFLLPQ